jgi:hypothetical protein
MPAILEPHLLFTPECSESVREYLAYTDALDAVFDPRGRIVRYAPWRRTVMHELPGGERVFCKHRLSRGLDSKREWHALHALRELGLGVPTPLFLALRERDSVIGIAAVPGRPADALLAEGAEQERLLVEMANVVRRLHGAGWAYRDLYWNHVFAQVGTPGVWLVDVERAFQPGSGFERWRIKDLAGLVSSLPDEVGVTRSAGLRFLREAMGDLPADYKTIARRVLAKAARIRGHVTKYPG